jgi:hypothetical protein
LKKWEKEEALRRVLQGLIDKEKAKWLQYEIRRLILEVGKGYDSMPLRVEVIKMGAFPWIAWRNFKKRQRVIRGKVYTDVSDGRLKEHMHGNGTMGKILV